MAKKVFVGNLSSQTKPISMTCSAKLGPVESVQIIMDRDTGRSRGFGFVQMSDDKAADTAIEHFNGKEVNGRALTVNEARPLEKNWLPWLWQWRSILTQCPPALRPLGPFASR